MIDIKIEKKDDKQLERKKERKKERQIGNRYIDRQRDIKIVRQKNRRIDR